MRARLQIVVTAAAAAFLLLPALGLPRSYAQDGTGDGGEKPAAPESMEFNDGGGTVAIDLPRVWRPQKGALQMPDLAAFEWPAENGQGNNATVRLLIQRQFARAELARQQVQSNVGAILDGSLRRGDGFAESCSIASAQAVYDRFVEKDGFVYQARFVCHRSRWDEYATLARAALETFTVRKPHTVPEMGDGWDRSKHKPYTVWCDDEDKDTPDRVMDPVLEVRKVMEKALRGDPADPLEPTVRIYRNAAQYEAACRSAFGQPQATSAYDGNDRALLVELMNQNQQGFDWSVQQMAAVQYIRQYFGGAVPLWITRGMMIYGAVGAAESNGKPEKAPKDRLKKVRGVVAASRRTLDQYFELDGQSIPDDQKTFDELWAWHWFLRHGRQGKKYRKTYEECLETLRETGDVEAAHAVWEGTDFEKLQDSWREWAKSLK